MKKKISIIGGSEINFPLNFEIVPELSELYTLSTVKMETSLISLMSKPLVFNRKKLYSGKDMGLTRHLLSEYEKDGLNDLIASNPDVVILDFFADVNYGILKTTSGTKLTNISERYQENPSFNDIVIKHKYNILDFFDLYVQEWTDALKKFMQFMEKYLQKTQIVINGNFNISEKDLNNISRRIAWDKLNVLASEIYHLPIINGSTEGDKYNYDKKLFHTNYAVNLTKVLYPEDKIEHLSDLMEITSTTNLSIENNIYDWNLIRNPYFKNGGEFWNVPTEGIFTSYSEKKWVSYSFDEKMDKTMSQIYTSNIDISSSKDSSQEFILSFDIFIDDVFEINIRNDIICTVRGFKDKLSVGHTAATDHKYISAYMENITSRKWKTIEIIISPTSKYLGIGLWLYQNTKTTVKWRNLSLKHYR